MELLIADVGLLWSAADGGAARTLAVLAAILTVAKVCAAGAGAIGQPAVLGELLAGVVLGGSALSLVDPHDTVLALMAEIGVVILLFEIGLETDLEQLLKVGPASTVVAIVGVALPFGLGYAVCWALGLGTIESVIAAATLTATSVGITARVLSDLGRLRDVESQIILGAAVIDDVVGLIILAVVQGVAGGEQITAGGVLWIVGMAFGFLIVTLAVGRVVAPLLARGLGRVRMVGTPTIFAVVAAFGLAWAADIAGSALIIGAFAAGLLLREVPQAEQIEHGVASLGHFFVPIFFVHVGASVDLRSLNPLDPAQHSTLLFGGLLLVAAVVSKFAAGFAPWWLSVNKPAIGAGMIPRGEVGLIFAQMGLNSGQFDAGKFSAVTLMVMATTFIAPPLLKALFKAKPGVEEPPSGIEELVSGPD